MTDFEQRLAASMERHKGVLDKLKLHEVVDAWKASGDPTRSCSNAACKLNYAHTWPCWCDA